MGPCLALPSPGAGQGLFLSLRKIGLSHTMKLFIAGPNLRNQSKGQLHVHSADCRRIEFLSHFEPEYANAIVEEHEDLLSLTLSTYPPDQFEWNPDSLEERDMYFSEFYLFPCCKDLPLDKARDPRPHCRRPFTNPHEHAEANHEGQ